jgi:hypothetical protein
MQRLFALDQGQRISFDPYSREMESLGTTARERNKRAKEWSAVVEIQE